MAASIAPHPRRSLLDKVLNPKSFVADVALLLAGAGSAQAILMVTAPLLSRLYTPAQFAGLALLTSTYGIVSRVSSFKYESAIATSRNRPEMGTLAALATLVLIGFTVLAIVAPLLGFRMLEARLGYASAIGFCICLPIVIFFDGMIQIVITWAVRWKQFKAVSSNDLTRNVTSVTTQAVAGLAQAGGTGLMLGQTVGTVIALAALGYRGTLGQLYRFATRSSWRRRRVVAHRFRDFPLYQMPKATMNAIARYSPPILISTYYSVTATGLFYLAFRLTALPAQLVALSLGRVLTQRFATLRNVKRTSLLPLLAGSTFGFAFLAAPIIVVTWLAGPELFGFFLGRKWEAAGIYAGWTALWSASLICGTPSQMSLVVQRKNRVLLIIEAVYLVPRLLPFPWFSASGDVGSAIEWCCITAVAYNATMILFGLYYAKVEGARIEAMPRGDVDGGRDRQSAMP